MGGVNERGQIISGNGWLDLHKVEGGGVSCLGLDLNEEWGEGADFMVRQG